MRGVPGGLPGKHQYSPHAIAPETEKRRKSRPQRKIRWVGSQPPGRGLHPGDAESGSAISIPQVGPVEAERLGRHAFLPIFQKGRDDSQGFVAPVVPLDPDAGPAGVAQGDISGHLEKRPVQNQGRPLTWTSRWAFLRPSFWIRCEGLLIGNRPPPTRLTRGCWMTCPLCKKKHGGYGHALPKPGRLLWTASPRWLRSGDGTCTVLRTQKTPWPTSSPWLIP